MRKGQRVRDSNKPSWRWKDRFHRSNPPFGLGIAAYVSRPTFDLLRSSSKEGKCVYHAIIKFLKYSTGELEQPLKGKQWSDDDGKLHSFSFKMGNGANQSLVILLGPFNVENEMDICKQGFLLHTIPITKEDPPVEEENLDMWVLITREYNEDPVVKTLLPPTWLNARRRTILVFSKTKEGAVSYTHLRAHET